MPLQLKPRRQDEQLYVSDATMEEPSGADERAIDSAMDADAERVGMHLDGDLTGGSGVAAKERVLLRKAPRGPGDAAALMEALVEIALGFASAADGNRTLTGWLRELQEGVHWDPRLHPRWPKGAHGGLGGEFMKVGQRFEHDGKQYDITHIGPGKIWAHVATHGTKHAPKTVEFTTHEVAAASHLDVKQLAHHEQLGGGTHVHVVKGVTRPAAEPIKGAKQDVMSPSFTGTVVDPYVAKDTHDASIPIPEGAKGHIDGEQWKQFGKLDQERFGQLVELHGKWQAGAAQKLVNQILQQADPKIRQLMESHYSQQYGSSSGLSLSLHGIFGAVLNKLKGEAAVEKARQEYEQTRELQDRVAGVLQWDLYHRTRAPDIAIFHRTSDKALFDQEIIAGNKPVFAGLSQSQKWGINSGFGTHTFATPMAIRHIVMSDVSADIANNPFHHSEWEVATGDSFSPDARSMTFTSLSGMQTKWLQSVTQEGAAGDAIEMLKASMHDQGASLPVPPSPPSIQMDHAGSKTWLSPPEEAKQGILQMKYAELGPGGAPVAKPAKDLDLKPGDYIEGMQGTRYLIIADPANAIGIRYFKLTNEGKAQAGTESHVEETGQKTSAFSGHSLWAGDDAYEFEANGAKAFKKLDGYFQLPTQTGEGTPEFNMDAYAFGDKAGAAFLKDFKAGDKFVVHNVPYEVVSEGPGANLQVKIKNLQDGKTGQINGDYKSTKLVLKPGFSEGGTQAVDANDFFEGPTVEMGSALDQLHLDTHFLVGKTVWRVKTHTPDGKVVASVAGMRGDMPPHDAAHIGEEHTFSADQKISVLTPKPPGWSPPKVGDTFPVEGEKATVTKLLKDGTVQARKAQGGVLKLRQDDPLLAGIHRPDDYEVGGKVKLRDMAPGEKFHGGAGAKVRPYQVVKQDGSQTVVRNLDTGEEFHYSRNKSFARLNLKTDTAISAPADSATPGNVALSHDPEAWAPSGQEKPLNELQVGDKFVGDQGAHMEIVGVEGTSLTWKNLATGEQTTAGVAGPIGNVKVPLVGVKGAPEPGESAHLVSPTGFDPAHYTEVPNDGPTVGDLSPGAVFKAEKGYYAVKQHHGTNMEVTNLQTGDSVHVALDEPFEAWLAPKAEKAPSYAQLAAGDQVELGKLKPGDWFHLPSGENGAPAVVQENPNKDEMNVLVKVGDNAYSMAPSTQVVFKGQMPHEASTLTDAQAGTLLTDPASLPEVAGYQSYKWHKSGSKTYPKIEQMAEGVVFQDSKGSRFKVKKAGLQPVVSDGDKLYKIDGKLRGLVLPDVAFEDTTVEHHGAAGLEVALAEHSMIPNLAKQNLGALGVQVGDSIGWEGQFEPPVWKVSEITPFHAGPGFKVSLIDPATGESSTADFKSVPDFFGKGGGSVADVKVGSAFDKGDHVTWSVGDEHDHTPYYGAVLDSQGTGSVKVLDSQGEVHYVPEGWLDLWDSNTEAPQAKAALADVMKNEADTPTPGPGPTTVADSFKQNTPGVTVGELNVGDQFSVATPGPQATVWEVTGYSGDKVEWKLVKLGDEKVEPGTGVVSKEFVPNYVSADTGALYPHTAQKKPGTGASYAALLTGDHVTNGDVVLRVTGVTDPEHVQTEVVKHLKDMPYMNQNWPLGSSQLIAMHGQYGQSGTGHFWEWADPPKETPQKVIGQQAHDVAVGDYIGNYQGIKLQVVDPALGQDEFGTPKVLTTVVANPLSPGEHPVGSEWAISMTPDTGWLWAAPPAGGGPLPQPVAALTPTFDPLNPPVLEKVGTFEPGALVSKGGYQNAVWQVVQHDHEKALTKLRLVKPRTDAKESKGNTVGYESSVPFASTFRQHGGPMWKKGEYVKVVKPGNKSGKTGVISQSGDESVTVAFKDGSKQTVARSHLRPVHPQYQTKADLDAQLGSQKLGDLQVGDVFKQHGYYAAGHYVVTGLPEVEGGKVKAKHVGTSYSAYEQSFSADSPVTPLLTKREAAVHAGQPHTPELPAADVSQLSKPQPGGEWLPGQLIPGPGYGAASFDISQLVEVGSKPVKDVQPGEWFIAQGHEGVGTRYKVLANDGQTHTIQQVESNGAVHEPVVQDVTVKEGLATVYKPADEVPQEDNLVSPADEMPPTHSFADLKPGDHFSYSPDGPVFQLESTGSQGAVISDTANGIAHTTTDTTVDVWARPKALPEKIPAEALAVGDTFTYDGPGHPETHAGYWTVTGFDKAGPVASYHNVITGATSAEQDVTDDYVHPVVLAGPSSAPAPEAKLSDLQAGEHFSYTLGGPTYKVQTRGTNHVQVQRVGTDESHVLGSASMDAMVHWKPGFKEPVKPGETAKLLKPKPQAPSSPKVPGTKLDVAALQAGDYISAGSGATERVYRVDSVDEHTPMGVKTTITLVSDKSGLKQIGAKLTQNIWSDHTGWRWGAPPETTPDGELVGYAFHKSGTKKYPKLASLSAGVHFHDKTGTEYVVVGKVGAHVEYRDVKSGKTFLSAPHVHVYALA